MASIPAPSGEVDMATPNGRLLAQIALWADEEPAETIVDRYDRDGYVIFPAVLTSEEIDDIRSAVAPHFIKSGRNPFEGYQTNRVYSLLAKAPEVFANMATHPLALAFAERDLGESCLLSALLAINSRPGETPQAWHHDDGHITVPLPRPAFGVSAFWTIDETTETNGATELIPGSHLWSDSAGHEVQSTADLANDTLAEKLRAQGREFAITKVALPAGSLMIIKGTLLHRGGANQSQTSRLIITPQYAPGWARQLENMLLAVPPEIAKTLPRRARELIGYDIHGAFMGFVDGVHPDRTLNIHKS
ncbi:MAG: phytanoyl-CoA dioxygenase family protein [Pseudomonadota bacterium]